MTTTTRISTTPRTAPMWRAGVLAAVAAAVATTAVAAVATGIGVPVEIDGAPIPLLGFAQLTLVFSA
ncbi:MAG: cell envelope biogenesis protein OmpA, partial [Streptosporangiales bacterium]|nr:cell envelope biogenesis protein OmpA [Streptosporangiales bacterium]